MICDMCGKDENLVRAIVEGIELNVCSSCKRYGAVVNVKKQRPKIEKKSIEIVNPQFASIIKKKRNSLGLSHEVLAKKMNQKESVVQNVEKGKMPSIELARKFEKVLEIKLVTKYEETHDTVKVDTEEPTIGNMIRIKYRK